MWDWETVLIAAKIAEKLLSLINQLVIMKKNTQNSKQKK